MSAWEFFLRLIWPVVRLGVAAAGLVVVGELVFILLVWLGGALNDERPRGT